jgi:Peptidase family M23
VSAPDLRIAVEPNINSGAVHYLRCAPSVAGGAERGLLSMALTLENVDTRQVHINKLGLSIAGSSTIIMPKTVDWVLDPHQPGASPYWVSAPSDQQFVIPAGPASMTLKLYAEGHSDPAVFQRSLAAHSSPTESGSYRFWGAVRDLRPGEFWAVDGKSHGQGNPAQVYAYDVDVAVESDSGYATKFPGADPGKNESYRIWNKPIYAVADGKVRQFRNNFPTNKVAGKIDPEVEKFWKSVADGGDGKDGNGNFFTIESGIETVLYAHMIAGSLNPSLLSVGATVKAGDYLGRAGNSGSSWNPHMHIHANRSSVHDHSWYEMPRPMPFHGARAVAWSSLGVDAKAAPWVLLDGRGVAPTACAVWPSGGQVVNLREVQLRHFTLSDEGQLWAVNSDNKVRLSSERLPPDGLVGAYLDHDPVGSAKEVVLLGAKPYLIGMDDRIWEGQTTQWARLPNSPSCMRIAADPSDGRIWAVTLDGRIMSLHLGQSPWIEHAGGGRAKDICVRNSRPYVIGMDDKIWQSQGPDGWSPLPGEGKGKRIAIDPQNGKLWVVGMNDGVWSHSGSGNWVEHPHGGRAKDLFIHRGTPYIIGLDNALWRSVGTNGWFRMNVVEPA